MLGVLGVAGTPLIRRAWTWWRERGWRSADQSALGAGERAVIAQRWLRAMLLLSAAGTLALYSLSKTAQLYQFTAARYLLLCYLTLPVLLGVLWEHGGRPLAARVRRAGLSWTPDARDRPLRWRTLSVRTSAPRWYQVAAGSALLLLLGFSVIGGIVTLAWSSTTVRFALPESAPDRQLIMALTHSGANTFVSDYWTCYRLAFESAEHLHCAVRDSVDGTLTPNGSVNRYQPYLDEVIRATAPAYVFPAGSAADTTFVSWASAHALPHAGYRRVVVAGQAIYLAPPPHP
jgi:hypothetical protein